MLPIGCVFRWRHPELRRERGATAARMLGRGDLGMTGVAADRVRLVILGPTAAGKTALAHAVALERSDTDLLSIDAMQVYRGMDIGTGKVPPEERDRFRYSMLDLVEATHEYTLADFVAAAQQAVAATVARRRVVIGVGGTGLYLRSLVDVLDLPGQWPEIRAELAREPNPVVLHRRLAELDPDAAARMERTNRRRIERALEVCLGSGRRFSSFGPGLDQYPPSPVAQLGLRWDRSRLAARIEQRVLDMLAAGWLAEVAALEAAGGLSRTAAQAIGYGELAAHLRDEMSLDEACAQTILRTRQFAVRQERWFRRDPRIRWVEVTDDPVGEALPHALELCTHR